MNRHTAPIIAAVLLLLPVLYVGSYFALVVPGGISVTYPKPGTPGTYVTQYSNYRVSPEACVQIFWPLELIDRKVRPGAWISWEDEMDSLGQFVTP